MTHIPEKIDSKYRYVLLASNRAEQLVEGASPKAEHAEGKPTRIAMAEISASAVHWDYGPEPEDEVAEAAGVEAEATDP